LPPGSNHTVTYTAADGCGNVETCSFDIMVESVTEVCNPGGQNSDCHYIEQCVFGSISNTSGDNGGYADYTTLCTGAGATDALSLQLVPGFGTCAAEQVYWTIWIDLNMDGDYYDANEFVAYGSGIHTMNGVITMPATLSTGESTMRIIMKQGGYANDPCEEYPNGETEDYCIQLFGNSNDNAHVLQSRSADSRDAMLLTEATVDNILSDNNYNISVYPNPVSALMTIESGDMDLYSPDGRIAKDIIFDANSDRVQVKVSELTTGMYNLVTYYQDGQRVAKKVIIQN
jgi:hypothetical protein